MNAKLLSIVLFRTFSISYIFSFLFLCFGQVSGLISNPGSQALFRPENLVSLGSPLIFGVLIWIFSLPLSKTLLLNLPFPEQQLNPKLAFVLVVRLISIRFGVAAIENSVSRPITHYLLRSSSSGRYIPDDSWLLNSLIIGFICNILVACLAWFSAGWLASVMSSGGSFGNQPSTE